jgi:tetratricopeptide (TPR) repeat protein
VRAGEGEAEVRGELTVKGGRLLGVALFLEGGQEVSARVEGELGEPERNNLFFRELALRLLTVVEPTNARAWVRLGITLRQEGLASQAVEIYRKAVGLEPTLASAHFNMGLAFDAMGDVPAAIAAYRKAVEADPAHVGAKYSWALDDLREREAGESEERFRRRVLRSTELLRQVRSLAPRNKEARYLLVEGLAMLGQASEALDECGRIQRIFPGDGRVYEVRGNLYLRLKRYREALVDFRKLTELEPSLITNAYFLGAALEGLGRWEEAAGRYEEFAEKSGDDPKFEKAREDARKKAETLRAGEKDGESR